VELPSYLEEQIRSGKVVLILGAGASLGAIDSKGNKAPKTDELRDVLSDKFLGGRLKNRGLSQVAECAISESSTVAVQEMIRELFEPLEPTEAHKLLPSFRWWGIATTNYERLIEKAYLGAPGRVQDLSPVIENGDRVDEYARDPRNLLLLKLHGCITRTANPDCPLILTVDQYVDHRIGRSRLFDRLTDWGFEHVFVFVGHSLQDPDIRQLLKDLTKEGANRARFYCVVPDADPIEQRALEQQRITVISGTFADFMKALDSAIATPFRSIILAPTASSLPIADRFRDRTALPSKNLAQFLTLDVDYVNSLQPTETVAPKDFYTGYNPGFSAIEQSLDVRRQISDEILTDVFLANESERSGRLELILIKAHAGAGKTVLMRRLAWEASHDYGCICLFLRTNGIINVAALSELVDLCSQRVFLFVDDSADRVREFESLVSQIGAAGRHVTVITAERINEWNVFCQSFSAHVTEVYELRYLTSVEIGGLLTLLEKHDAEGELKSLPASDKRKEFEERAGRQLLVALHEATLGLPFVEIIRNEFDHIWPLEAKQVYLTICVLNRLNVPVRAGIISRVHGIAFEDFKQRMLTPLEHIVQAEFDSVSRDYVYRARHPHIAQIVFDTILVKQEDRFDSYMRCLGALNIDYSTDRIAFRQMTRAKVVIDLFPSHDLGLLLYKSALERAGQNDGTLAHQMALYELNRPEGTLSEAETLMAKAAELRPYDISITHSFAELQLRLSEEARTPLEKEKYLREATSLCREYNRRAKGESYGFSTLAKIGLVRLIDALTSGDAVGIENAIRDVEQALQDGLQASPGDSYLRNAEARLAELIADSGRAIAALQKAFQTNPRVTFIAVRLANLYQRASDPAKATATLEAALAANPNDVKLHYSYAQLLISGSNGNPDSILYHLQRSFVRGDANYDAQLLYGRYLFGAGYIDRAKDVFRDLSEAAVKPEIRFALNYPLEQRFRGEVVRLESTYCFIARDGIGDWIYAYRTNTSETWASLSRNARVTFEIAFSFKGPNAFDLQLDRPAPLIARAHE